MQFYVGITDLAWYQYLSAQNFDEINFWRPNNQSSFKAIPPGGPFLFKLKKSAGNAIVGVAFFQHFKLLPIRTVWDVFEQENGSPNYAAFLNALGKFSADPRTLALDRKVGCIILGQPTFFKREDWIETPTDWGSGIQEGKRYDTADLIGRSLWSQVEARLGGTVQTELALAVNEQRQVYGKGYLAKTRLGQGLFRIATLENYQSRCCITGESTEPVLEAAHILPVAKGGENLLNNGLALRADMHILYDRGLLSVDPDLKIHVSSRIKDLYHNGVVYYAHEGAELRSLPSSQEASPNRDLLDWHFREAFIA
jgi:putative restriction endonuclease